MPHVRRRKQQLSSCLQPGFAPHRRRRVREAAETGETRNRVDVATDNTEAALNAERAAELAGKLEGGRPQR